MQNFPCLFDLHGAGADKEQLRKTGLAAAGATPLRTLSPALTRKSRDRSLAYCTMSRVARWGDYGRRTVISAHGSTCLSSPRCRASSHQALCVIAHSRLSMGGQCIAMVVTGRPRGVPCQRARDSESRMLKTLFEVQTLNCSAPRRLGPPCSRRPWGKDATFYEQATTSVLTSEATGINRGGANKPAQVRWYR